MGSEKNCAHRYLLSPVCVSDDGFLSESNFVIFDGFLSGSD